MTLSYAGRSLPSPPPGGISFELQPIDSAERNAEGDMILDEITMKIKVSVKWKNLTGTEANLIFSVLRNNRTGSFRFFDISANSDRTIQAYYGAGAKIDYLKFDGNLGAQLYSNMTANFIEI